MDSNYHQQPWSQAQPTYHDASFNGYAHDYVYAQQNQLPHATQYASHSYSNVPHHDVRAPGNGHADQPMPVSPIDPEPKGGSMFAHIPKPSPSLESKPTLMAPAPVRHKPRYAVFAGWTWEIAAILLATGLVVAIAIILISFDGRPVPDWGHAVTFSALVALIATIFRSMIVLVIAAIISQSKWTWFHQQTRSLHHLETFDLGSRGLVGSLRLLPTAIRGDAIATLAAVLMIVSVAVGPFVQQAIKTTPCLQRVESIDGAQTAVATIPYAHFVPRFPTYRPVGPFNSAGKLLNEAKGIIYSSITDPAGPQNQVQATCTSGHCTFMGGDPLRNGNLATESTYSSIGLCHACADVGSLVMTSYKDTSVVPLPFYSLPDGPRDVSQNGYGEVLKVTTNTSLAWASAAITDPTMRRAMRWSFANITVLSMTNKDCKQLDKNGTCPNPVPALGPEDVTAMACILYPCLRTYIGSVVNGSLVEKLLDVEPATPDFISQNGSIYDGIPDGISARYNWRLPYVAVHTPCRLSDGAIFAAQNISLAPNTTRMLQYVINDDFTEAVKEVNAPEQCIYRHDAGFGYALSEHFHSVFSNQTCRQDPRRRLEPTCGTDPNDYSGVNVWLDMLYNQGNMTTAIVDDYFGAMALSVTNKYRMRWGAGPGFNPVQSLGMFPQESRGLGTVSGTAWQTTVCTSLQWRWLFLPALLTAGTLALLIAILVRGWRTRHAVPVWKDSMMPLVFYRERFEAADGSRLEITPQKGITSSPGGGHRWQGRSGGGDEVLGADEAGGRLLEANEMSDTTRSMIVHFEYPRIDGDAPPSQMAAASGYHYHGAPMATTGSAPGEKKPNWRFRRQEKQRLPDRDSLMMNG